MSRFARSLIRAMKYDKLSFKERCQEILDDTIEKFLDFIHYYEIKNFIQNLRWMIPAAAEFRPWDFMFNIDLFCRSLDKTGDCLIKHGMGRTSRKMGIRAKTAAHKLIKAYKWSKINDKSYMYYAINNPLELKDHSIVTCYKKDAEFSEKLKKVIDKRCELKEQKQKDEAWAYLIKYLPYFWD